ncbi:hypothetical protein B0F90DRAFT_1687428 [Multifurca ochricompacta]|uniref:MARVEL domain-containing protein n=1 Tax=Multifurca ochricompacta TaxID=376703 RepID=A0AAD4MC39_9AGAM|nr:hypothetical protein B0F90DRAFT_1687428 [Multifurca ochricompacta]
MTVLFRNLRIFGYASVLLLSAAVLGIASYLASQFLPHIRFAFTTYSLVAPSFTIVVLIILLFWSRPWIDAIFLLISTISWLALAAWVRDINGPAECHTLGSSRTHTAHGTISSQSFCYLSKVLEGLSWSIFILLMFFLIFVIALANRSQILGRPHIWNEDVINLPWFGQYPGYSGLPLYPLNPDDLSQAVHPAPTIYEAPPQIIGNGGVIQQQPGHSIIIWPGINGEPPRIEQRPGFVTHSTL